MPPHIIRRRSNVCQVAENRHNGRKSIGDVALLTWCRKKVRPNYSPSPGQRPNSGFDMSIMSVSERVRFSCCATTTVRGKKQRNDTTTIQSRLQAAVGFFFFPDHYHLRRSAPPPLDAIPLGKMFISAARVSLAKGRTRDRRPRLRSCVMGSKTGSAGAPRGFDRATLNIQLPSRLGFSFGKRRDYVLAGLFFSVV